MFWLYTRWVCVFRSVFSLLREACRVCGWDLEKIQFSSISESLLSGVVWVLQTLAAIVLLKALLQPCVIGRVLGCATLCDWILGSCVSLWMRSEWVASEVACCFDCEHAEFVRVKQFFSHKACCVCVVGTTRENQVKLKIFESLLSWWRGFLKPLLPLYCSILPQNS